MPLHSNFTLDLELDSMFQQSIKLVINIQETSSWCFLTWKACCFWKCKIEAKGDTILCKLIMPPHLTPTRGTLHVPHTY
jgi:hypothetical protein